MTTQASAVSFEPLTADHVAEVRSIVRDLAKQHSQRVHVRKVCGASAGSITISGDPHATDPALRIAVCEALIAAGFEDVLVAFSPDSTLANHHVRLAREWEHAHLNVMVAKLAHA